MLRIAQYGTKHGHATGKLDALRRDPRVDFAGVYEPDTARRRELERATGPFAGVRWFDEPGAILGDPSIVAVASEGRNDESLAHTEELVRAGKHVWYDKPAGQDWERWRGIVALAERRGLVLQMGYMFRYHAGFRQIAAWARSGLLGRVYAVRAHMSTGISPEAQRVIAAHHGGILYDLGGHMLDQIVWLLGRPERASAFLRSDGGVVPGFHDNTLAVLEFPGALASVDIAAMEVAPQARRFEVYGDEGSAIMEPFEPCGPLRLTLAAARGGFNAGEQLVTVPEQSRQQLYDLELEAFVAAVLGERPPDRTLAHELLVQETLLRATGDIREV
jgi:predicted dehydrogenase